MHEMKAPFIILCLTAITISAQLSDNQRIGAFSIGGGGGGVARAPRHSPQLTPQIFTVNGEKYANLTGEVAHIKDNVLIFHDARWDEHGVAFWEIVVITNYPSLDKLVDDQKLNVCAKPIGTLRLDESQMEFYEYIDRAKIDAEQAAETQANVVRMAAIYKAEAAAAKLKADQQKQIAATIALKSNQDAAGKGDSFGLMRMGERYRDGEGVEKDSNKARSFLQKAFQADTNNFIAKEELDRLPEK
jgi:hypothetical protein